eukprot:TRINITY_DN8430_c0_g1_i2.p1 TRINITY_DN8430_c0_g1~~TRINITY_DN8430_c0_g1_i2.p1  ORF type:complete len:196 (+),score=63.62 TRINITY_DN8430_c0_g1_i2:56-589(+)
MFRVTRASFGRRTEFLARLEKLNEGLAGKISVKKHWEEVYAEDCVMTMAGQEVKGLSNIIEGIPQFTRSFDIEPVILEVVGEEDAEKFAVWYRHKARFVQQYGKVKPTGHTGSFEGVNIHTVDAEGRTTHLVQSMDLLSYFMQVDAVPSIFDSQPEESMPDLGEGAGTVKVGGVKEI